MCGVFEEYEIIGNGWYIGYGLKIRRKEVIVFILRIMERFLSEKMIGFNFILVRLLKRINWKKRDIKE